MTVPVMTLCSKCYESMRVFYQLDAVETDPQIRMCSLCIHDRPCIRYAFRSRKKIRQEQNREYRRRYPIRKPDRRARYRPRAEEED